jgi:hypothetical protein
MSTNPYASPQDPGQSLPRQVSSGVPELLKVLAVIVAIFLVIAMFVLPNIRFAGEAARRTQCNNNLKQISIGMQNYLDINGTFPPAYVADADGKPMHSWRVLLLEYMELGDLYERYDQGQPWDSEANQQVLHQKPFVYQCPSTAHSNRTSYVVVRGTQTVFDADKPCHPASITDGLANTILVVEAPHADIPWTEPRDLDFDELTTAITQGANSPHSDHPNLFLVLLADGSVRQISNTVSPHDLRCLLTKAGGDTVSDDF